MNKPEQINNPSRRRLAKGVIAGPAVLATITSKHALGATYACTVSGHDSANVSRGHPADCVDGYKDVQAWSDHFQYTSASRASELTPADFGVTFETTKTTGKNSTTTSAGATFRQAFRDLSTDRSLNSGSQTVKSVFKYDKALTLAGLAVYLNVGPTYHIRDTSRVLEIFRVATQGGILSGTKWDKLDCEKFLLMLGGLTPYAPRVD